MKGFIKEVNPGGTIEETVLEKGEKPKILSWVLYLEMWPHTH